MPYQQTTLANLRTRLQARQDNSVYWVDEEMRLALNESLRVWNLLTQEFRGRVVMNAVNGPYIAPPVALTQHTRVQFDSSPLDKTSLPALSAIIPGWEGQRTTDGGAIPVTVQNWAPVGLYLLAIWPTEPTAAHALVLDGVAITPILVNEADYIDAGEELLDRLIDYAQHVLTFKIAGASFAESLPKYRRFIQAAGVQNARFRASSLYKRVMAGDAMRLFTPLALPRAQEHAQVPPETAAAAQVGQ